MFYNSITTLKEVLALGILIPISYRIVSVEHKKKIDSIDWMIHVCKVNRHYLQQYIIRNVYQEMNSLDNDVKGQTSDGNDILDTI